MQKLLPILSIFGPTGAGKTAVALALAKLLIEQEKVSGVDIISADSRQVYRDIPILSGADVPEEFENFTSGKIRLHGIGMLAADESWSLGQFQSLCFSVFEQAKKDNRAVLVVGGTALYHKQLLQADPRLRVLPNMSLRAELEELSVEQLQKRLAIHNTKRLEDMNDSDRANPRRLIRAIEQESAHIDLNNSETVLPKQEFLSVSAPGPVLEQRITERVRQRFTNGAVVEVQKILKLPIVSEQLQTACGFAEISQFLAGEIDESTCLQNWADRELQYSKSQQKWETQFPDAHTDLLQVIDSVY